jgi:hypothetical protein
MRVHHWLVGVLLAMSVGFTAPAALAGPKEDVAAATAKWAAIFADNNPDTIVALYSADGVLWGSCRRPCVPTPQR